MMHLENRKKRDDDGKFSKQKKIHESFHIIRIPYKITLLFVIMRMIIFVRI